MHSHHPSVVQLIGRNVQAQLRPIATLQVHGRDTVLGRLLWALPLACCQGIACVFGRRDGWHLGVGIDRAQLVDHAVVLGACDLAVLQVGDGLLKLFGALEPVGIGVGHAAGFGVLLLSSTKARFNYFTGYDTQANVSFSLITHRVFQGVQIFDAPWSDVKLGVFGHQALVAVLVKLFLCGDFDRLANRHRANCFGRTVPGTHNGDPFSNIGAERIRRPGFKCLFPVNNFVSISVFSVLIDVDTNAFGYNGLVS